MEKIYERIEKYFSIKDYFRQTASGQKIFWYCRKAYLIESRRLERSILVAYYDHMLFLLGAELLVIATSPIKIARVESAGLLVLLFCATVGHLYYRLGQLLLDCPVAPEPLPGFWTRFDWSLARMSMTELLTYLGLGLCLLLLAGLKSICQQGDWSMPALAGAMVIFFAVAIYRKKKQPK